MQFWHVPVLKPEFAEQALIILKALGLGLTFFESLH